MIQKKICMIGSFAVGKTSLVNRFVRSIFSEKYLTTIGVKIDKKLVDVDNININLILWDIHGEDDYEQIQMSYLRGASGYLLVADGTRKYTLDKAYELKRRVESEYGELPFILVINKKDLKEELEISDKDKNIVQEYGWNIMFTSAKTGEGVEEVFEELARKLIDNKNE